ncbi:Oidioi.mRNA.OKI2018_I69.PAR.g10082.t1.cds [Oikopleura dioica]|uniref:Oidioi.mRNA.OKI2018_I69.PAR.g10082.t1.cds n=1 Tax=Oikopleura dioica TaxID=34765 RepID=A0ABN7RNU9_OIKDI|nr:Oidioi.mRNA.OKI2018_I69.PAR.g10082.t1.cds [Oikopleura dioica]
MFKHKCSPVLSLHVSTRGDAAQKKNSEVPLQCRQSISAPDEYFDEPLSFAAAGNAAGKVTQWEISGKDIFDLDYDIDNSIECIPDVTMDNESGMHEHWMFLNKEVTFSSEKQIGQTSKAILKLARLSSSSPEVVYLFKYIVDFCDTAND